MISPATVPDTYPLEVYRLQSELRRRRRERLAPATTPTPWRVPRSRLPQALRDELDAIALAMHAADPMPIPPNDKEISMHLQLVDAEPEQPYTAATEAPGAQPHSRAEWRVLVEAKCAERGIRLADACREMGLSSNFFSPSGFALGTPLSAIVKLQQWLDDALPADIPEPVSVPPPGIEVAPATAPAAVPLEYSYTGPVPLLPPAPAPKPRRYPAINIEPSAMTLDDLVEYLERLRALMPGATVTWSTAITVGVE